MGTPTMGGVMFLVPVFLITVVLNLANFLSGVEWGKRILAIFNFAEGSSADRQVDPGAAAGAGGVRLAGRPRRLGRHPRHAAATGKG